MTDYRDSPPAVAQEAADWHARLRRGPLSELEEARFRAWLAGDPARRKAFDELAELWGKLDALVDSPEVLATQRDIARRGVAHRVSRRGVVGWALAASVAGTVGFLSWQKLPRSRSYSTGLGESRVVTLDDGSVITLNTLSRVEVRLAGRERLLTLSTGQAHFEVAKDPARPFIVRVGAGEVRALGTAFDVYQRESEVLVTLVEGRVSVAADIAPSIILKPGEQVTFGGQEPPRVSLANLEQAQAWRRRKLDFRETPLAVALAEANRYSSLKIELGSPELADRPVSGVFDAGENEALVSALEAFLGVQVERRQEDLIVLTR